MSVTLSQLIDQVREELLAPRRAGTPDAMYPLLFVEEVELEVGVRVSSRVQGGGKVNIQVIEFGSGIEDADEETHRVTVRMTPLLSKEEVRQKLEQDQRFWQKTERVITRATTKEGGMVGEEE